MKLLIEPTVKTKKKIKEISKFSHCEIVPDKNRKSNFKSREFKEIPR